MCGTVRSNAGEQVVAQGHKVLGDIDALGLHRKDQETDGDAVKVQVLQNV